MAVFQNLQVVAVSDVHNEEWNNKTVHRTIDVTLSIGSHKGEEDVFNPGKFSTISDNILASFSDERCDAVAAMALQPGMMVEADLRTNIDMKYKRTNIRCASLRPMQQAPQGYAAQYPNR